MENLLIVVDMQGDFVDGSLGTPEAQAIVPAVVEKVKSHEGRVIFTRDTHHADYLQTREGRYLPVAHCVEGTEGWQIVPELRPYAREIVDKPTFGSSALAQSLAERAEGIGRVEIVGLCTDICVVSNALLIKAFLPEADIAVDARCCAGVTPEKHRAALETMRSCQIDILGEEARA